MSKDAPGLGGRLKDLLHRISGAEVIEEQEPADIPETEPDKGQPSATENRNLDQIPIAGGALLDVWCKWAGYAHPPTLSLNSNSSALPLDDHTLLKERVRLSLALERDAKKRLADLLALEKAVKKAAEDAAAWAVDHPDEEPKPFEAPPPLAATCQVYLADNRLVAWAFLFPPSSPDVSLSFELVGKAMHACGITTGIDSTAITRMFQEKDYFHLVPIAIGTPAIEGENGQIIEHYPRTLTKEVKIDEKGIADYRAQNYVQLINRDDVICDIVPPLEGVAGVRVDGKVLAPKPVHPAKIPNGRNTNVSEDGLHVVAALDGHLQYSNGSFHVRPVLEIKGDVDYSTGNIDFHGDVHIAGDVRETFSVRASGTITIDGLVEAAVIEAGGDLVIASGVLGNYKAVIKSWGSIRVKYLENCVVYASKAVYADCIMASQVFSDESIHVTSGRGTIIGGTLTAAHTVTARLIGCQAGRKTKIVLGQQPFLETDLQNSQADLASLQEEIQKLDANLKFLLEQQRLAGGASADLSKAQLRKSVLTLKEMKLMQHLSKLQPEDPDLSKCRLEASVVYPLTQVVIGQDCLNLEHIKNSCKLKYNVQLSEFQML